MVTVNFIIILAVIVAFYVAINIGGNDVANAMGTSVASKAVTYKQAVLIAAIFEFCGAFFVGSHVTNTVRKGMLDLMAFQKDPDIIIYGMTAALIATAVWLRIATHFGLPVSTSHSIVGAVVGFGIIAKGFSVVKWTKIISIVFSWIISPFFGGIIAFILFTFIRTYILETKNPLNRTRATAPFLVFMVASIIVLSLLYKGLKNLNMDMPLARALLIALAAGALAFVVSKLWINSHFKRAAANGNMNYARVEDIFKVLQILTACYVAFAHGANDVANAIGPLAAVLSVSSTHKIATMVPVPMWVLAMGGVGIVIGLLLLGARVMETIGKKITEIVPSRGFSAEFSAATTVLICSKLGMPISTTHTIVGAVIGVGFARGIGALDLKVIKDIINSWFITLPATVLFSVVFFKLIMFIRI